MNPHLFKDVSRLDASDLAFVARQLEQVRAKPYDVKYPNLKARQLVPVDNTVNPGAETVKYNQYDMFGLAALISSYSQDLPRADIKVKEFRQALKSMATSYGYNIQEMRAAAFAGVPLDAKKANAARRAFEELVDKIGATGDSNNGLTGFLNLSNVNSVTPATKAATGTTWAVATGLEMLKDLNSLAIKSVSVTNGVEAPDTIVLDIDNYHLAATTPLQSGVQVTVLSQFLATSPYIRSVESWYKLKGAGSGATNRAVCYRKDPDALQLIIPQEFEQFPPQQRGLEFVVPCHGRIGGVVAYYPMSISYMDGI